MKSTSLVQTLSISVLGPERIAATGNRARACRSSPSKVSACRSTNPKPPRKNLTPLTPAPESGDHVSAIVGQQQGYLAKKPCQPARPCLACIQLNSNCNLAGLGQMCRGQFEQLHCGRSAFVRCGVTAHRPTTTGPVAVQLSRETRVHPDHSFETVDVTVEIKHGRHSKAII